MKTFKNWDDLTCDIVKRNDFKLATKLLNCGLYSRNATLQLFLKFGQALVIFSITLVDFGFKFIDVLNCFFGVYFINIVVVGFVFFN